ncbi:MAG: hypothetical protein GF317_10105 [Candidatus Lokiarchaeota archaeon]|nr:hypothetical protein [Candidatus Lokiarchaeota archaeon]
MKKFENKQNSLEDFVAFMKAKHSKIDIESLLQEFEQSKKGWTNNYLFEIEYPKEFKNNIKANPNKTIEEHIAEYAEDLQTYFFEFDDGRPKFYTTYTKWEGQKYKAELEPTRKIDTSDGPKQFYKVNVTKI